MIDPAKSSDASKRFAGRVAVVTGGSAGIGREVCLELARAGAKVVIAARGAVEGEKAAEMVRGEGGEAVFVSTDVTQAASVKAMVDACIEHFGRLDFAFNNAGVTGSVTDEIVDYPEETFDNTIAVNFKGPWLCMKYEIPEMLKLGAGSIVNCASSAALRGGARASAYYSSKHALLGLTKSVALETATRGVRINAICPGLVQTEMVDREFANAQEKLASLTGRIPMGRFAAVREISAAVLWLFSDESTYVTGVALPTDGGWSI